MEQRNVLGLTRRLGLAGTLGLAGLTLTGCKVAPPDNAFFQWLRMGWPQGVTPEAKQLGNFWVWVWVAAWIIGIIMWVLLFYVIAKYNSKARTKRGDHEEFPRQTGYNVPLELVLTTLPVIIVMGLFFFNVQAQEQATALDKDPKVTIDVTGYQWNWKFGYSRVDGSLLGGKDYVGEDPAAQERARESMEGPKKYNAHGEEIPGPIHGKSKQDYSYLRFDKIETVGTTEEVPVLVLPSRTAIQFDLASADVSHAFWVPEFLFKRDVYAHPEANKSERRFQISEVSKEGAYVGRCAEMCGTYHSMMNFEIRVVSPEQFRQYIQYREANPKATNAEALKSIGEAPYATSTSPFVPDRTGTRTPDTNAVQRNA